MAKANKTAQFTPGPWKAYNVHKGRILKHWQVDTGTGKVMLDDAAQWEAGNATLIAAAPAMYEALTTLLPEEDIVSTDNGPDECRWCGRTYPDYDNEGELQVLCTSDDCPGYIARQAIAQAEGKQ